MAKHATDDALMVAAAFQHLGIDVAANDDLVVLATTGEPIAVHRGEPGSHHGSQIVVRDRMAASERHRLRSQGVGWLDLGGHLSFRSPSIIVDADVPTQSKGRSQRSTSVLAGEVISGITMLALAVWPSPLLGVRAAGRSIKSSPGGASLAIKRLVDAGLLTADYRATAELFWTAAAEWRPEWIDLPVAAFPRDIPTVAVGAHAASRYGAPIVVTADARQEFLVGSRAALNYTSMAASSPHGDHDIPTGRFAISPAAVIVDQIAPDAPLIDGVPAAPEAIVALSLAIDPGRGAETVRGWEGNHVW